MMTGTERVPMLLDLDANPSTVAAGVDRIWDGMFVSKPTWEGLKQLLALPEAAKVDKLRCLGGLEVYISKYSPFGMAAMFQWGNHGTVDWSDPVKSFYMSQQPHIVAMLDFTKELKDANICE